MNEIWARRFQAGGKSRCKPWPQKASGIQADRGLHTRVGNIKKREIILASRRPGKIFTARLFRLALCSIFFFFFFWLPVLYLFIFIFFLRHLTSSRFTHSLSFFLSLFLSLPFLRLYVRSFRFDSLFNLYRGIVQPIPKLTVLRSTKLDDRRKIWYRVGRGNVPGNGLALRLG